MGTCASAPEAGRYPTRFSNPSAWGGLPSSRLSPRPSGGGQCLHPTGRLPPRTRSGAVDAVNHRNIPARRLNYIVTELVEGESLRGLKLTPRRAIAIVAQVADGLGAAHSGEIVHRDLKPDNVMVTRCCAELACIPTANLRRSTRAIRISAVGRVLTRGRGIISR
jgi:hypothetical protein